MTPTREQLTAEQAIAQIKRVLDTDDGYDTAVSAIERIVAAALAPQEAAPGASNVPIPEHHQRAAATFRALATPVPMSEAERAAHDTDYGLTPEAAPMPPIEVGDWVEDNIHIRAVLADRDVEWWNSSEAAGMRLNVTEIRKANGTVWRRP